MQQNKFLLYGANGYTGQLIARYANHYDLQPILAGRNAQALQQLGEKLNMPYKAFPLSNTAALEEALSDVNVVIHAAGPFDTTAKPMVEACIKTRTHYLDINGDFDVYEMLHSYDGVAKQANIMVMSGAGFDVVPTDCLALFLKNRLPEATSLKLAFATPGGGLSHGTATTSLQKLGEPGASRKNGEIVPEPLGKRGMRVDFGKQQLFVMSLPWGDVYTAYHTTGIPDIESYTAVPSVAYYLLKLQALFNPLLKTSPVKNFVKKIIDSKPPGLNDTKREKATSLIWGQVKNAAGKAFTARLFCPDAYTLTALTTLLITKKVLNGNFKAGYQTPAGVYGEDLIMEIDGVKREIV